MRKKQDKILSEAADLTLEQAGGAVGKVRLQWLDALKGFLMLLVIWSHSALFMGQAWAFWVAAGYMGVYFFVAGYTLPRGKIQWCTFLQNKAKRMLLPCFGYGCLLVTIDFLWKFFTVGVALAPMLRGYLAVLYNRGEIYRYVPGAQNIAMLQWYNATLWFLSTLFVASILAACYLSCAKVGRVICGVLYLLAAYLLQFSPWQLPWGCDIAFTCALVMLAGYYYRGFHWEALTKQQKWLFFAVAITAYTVVEHYNQGVNLSRGQYGNYGLVAFLLLSVLAAVCYCTIFRYLPEGRCLTCLGWIGRNSIPFICLQLTVMGWVLRIVLAVWANLVVIGVLQIVSAVVVCGVVAFVKERLSRRFAWLKYF